MFNNDTSDFRYSFQLSKNDIRNLGLVQKFLSHPCYDEYDDYGNYRTPEPCQVSFNEAVSHALYYAADLYQQMMWEKQHRFNLTEDDMENITRD